MPPNEAVEKPRVNLAVDLLRHRETLHVLSMGQVRLQHPAGDGKNEGNRDVVGDNVHEPIPDDGEIRGSVDQRVKMTT